MKNLLEHQNTLTITKKNILKPYQEILTSMKDVYIFGAKRLGTKLAKYFSGAGYNVLGFLDNDKQKQGTYIDEIKVFAPEQLNAYDETFVIIIASLNYFHEIYAQVKNLGFKKILPYHILTVFNKEVFIPEFTIDGLCEDLCQNKEKYEQLFNLLEDDKSKIVLNQVMKFRQTYDMASYLEINDGIEKHYFEDFVSYSGQPFVDGGAFDGDTIENFIKFSKCNYRKIYLFEPDQKSFDIAKVNLSQYPNIEFYQKGLSDCEKTLIFDARGDLGSVFCEDGTEEIQCVSLDDVVQENQAFIKLDIEGAELEAIKGSVRLIKNNSILAICVYHNSSHIWQIPEIILNINPNYKFYLRHYTNFHFETVLYAIPKMKESL